MSRTHPTTAFSPTTLNHHEGPQTRAVDFPSDDLIDYEERFTALPLPFSLLVAAPRTAAAGTGPVVNRCVPRFDTDNPCRGRFLA